MSTRGTSRSGNITTLKIIDGLDESKSKVIKLKDINYRQDFTSLQKFLEMSIRMSPTDPIYSIEKVVLKAKEDAASIVLNADNYDTDIQSSMLSLQNSVLLLHVTLRPPSRSKSRGKGRIHKGTPEKNENVNNTNVLEHFKSPVMISRSSSRTRGPHNNTVSQTPTNISRMRNIQEFFAPPTAEKEKKILLLRDSPKDMRKTYAQGSEASGSPLSAIPLRLRSRNSPSSGRAKSCIIKGDQLETEKTEFKDNSLATKSPLSDLEISFEPIDLTDGGFETTLFF